MGNKQVWVLCYPYFVYMYIFKIRRSVMGLVTPLRWIKYFSLLKKISEHELSCALSNEDKPRRNIKMKATTMWNHKKYLVSLWNIYWPHLQYCYICFLHQFVKGYQSILSRYYALQWSLARGSAHDYLIAFISNSLLSCPKHFCHNP